MNAPSSSSPTRPRSVGTERALVLGGGGATGNAWLIGVIAGLADAGIDVTAPDLIVGTSAGSTAAVQLSHGFRRVASLRPRRRPGEPARGTAIGNERGR